MYTLLNQNKKGAVMPMNVMSIKVRPEMPQQVYLNINKINKHVNSKHGLEAAKRYEENMGHIDYWHPQYAPLIRDEAINSLNKYISAVFKNKLTPIEQSAVSQQIVYNVNTKIKSKIDALDGISFYNVGKAGDEVLKCAMERDRHLNNVEAVLNEARRNGQKVLNREQTKYAEGEYKQAAAYENRRVEYVGARLEAMKKNEQIASEKGSKVLEAYHYLYDAPGKAK